MQNLARISLALALLHQRARSLETQLEEIESELRELSEDFAGDGGRAFAIAKTESGLASYYADKVCDRIDSALRKLDTA